MGGFTVVPEESSAKSTPIAKRIGNIIPQSVEVERQILGGLLLDREAIDLALEKINEDDFYLEKHKKLFQVIRDMHTQSSNVDIITLVDVLEKRNFLQEIGGEAYLLELSSEIVSWANISSHCEIIKEKSMLREMIQRCTEILKKCYSYPENISELVDEAEAEIFKIGERQISKGLLPIAQVLSHTFKLIDLYSSKEIMGVPTGMMDLDQLTGGFQKTDLIVLAGRPAMGKTAVTLSMMANSAIRYGKSIAFFSLEMGKEQLVQRILCREAKVNLQELRTGRLPKSHYAKFGNVAGHLEKAKIFIDDSVNQTPLMIRSKCRRLAQQHGLDMVIIDYLQLMTVSGKVENRTQEISQISRSLKALAKELQIPVVALSQLNRSVESRPDGRPMLSDLRESGSIEQDADIVAFIYREEVYKKDDPSLQGLAKLIISKQRNGPTGEVDLTFIKEYASFENYSPRLQEEGGF